MRSEGIPYLCALCGQAPVWQGLELTLQVDHIDGNALDSRLQNLRFLCPNCHTQTETYGRRLTPPQQVKGFLTPQRVREIREAYGPWVKNRRGKVPLKVLADRYGVTAATISRVLSGDRWQNVEQS